MIRTQISFDKSLYERAKQIARRQGVSLAELCRRSLAEAVARNESDPNRPWMRHLGVIEGGSDDSTTVDEVVYGRDRP
ncbi:MAG TPA: CopG family transcriptional regulator [Rhizomicrobium sp.]|nr:CopG family transcriptional regulator [Rhizomicrobium sp.]